MVVEGLQRAGAGALYEQFLRLKARLEADGLFDAERKRDIVAFPKRVAVVTSLAAAALRDVVTALGRRAPHVEVVIFPCSVQGAEAPAQIVNAMSTANAWDRQARRQDQGFDALILCRGGGSLEDLWAFNDERVVRSVVASGVPVICGVGHETDITLADLAADLRAPTPTAAAELVARAAEQAHADLDALADALRWRLRQRLNQLTQHVDRLGLRLARPAQVVVRHRQRLVTLQSGLSAGLLRSVASAEHGLAPWPHRLQQAIAQSTARAHQRLDVLGSRLSALASQRVLERGYAWLGTSDGAPLVSAAQVHAGQSLTVTLADGSLDVDVRSVHCDRDGPR